MAKVRVGLNGFGRIGRNIFRILAKHRDIEVAAISDIADAKSLEYLLKYDTLLGRFPESVSLAEGMLTVGDKKIPLLNGREPGDVKWGDHKVDVVIEATNRARSHADASKHLTAGAKRVLLCVPSTDKADITVVMGVNHKDITAKHTIISHASVTAHAAVPLVKILDDAFGTERMFYTAISAYSTEQRLADVPAGHPRLSRAAAENIVPVESKSEALIGVLVPALKGKVSAMSLKVPVPNGSVVDMVTFTKKPITVQAVNDAVKSAAQGAYKHIVEYMADPIVSSDVKQSPYSSTYDSEATMVLGQNAVKTLSWFDNGWGYAQRAVDLVEFLAKEGGLS